MEPERGKYLKGFRRSRRLKLHERSARTDSSILREFQDLTDLTLPRDAKEIEFLRDCRKLVWIGFAEDPDNGLCPDKMAGQFWKEYDAQKK